MPTYDYDCQECGHELEAFHAMSADPLRDCPACGKPGLKRRIGTGAGLLFKGSGFYQTDYRSESYKKSAEAEKAKPSSGSGSKTETAPAAKPAASPSSPAASA